MVAARYDLRRLGVPLSRDSNNWLSRFPRCSRETTLRQDSGSYGRRESDLFEADSRFRTRLGSHA